MSVMGVHVSNGHREGYYGRTLASLFLCITRSSSVVLSKAKECGAYLVWHHGLRQWAKHTAGVVSVSSWFWKNRVSARDGGRRHGRRRLRGDFCRDRRLGRRSPASRRHSSRQSTFGEHSGMNELFWEMYVGVAECVVTRGDRAGWDIVHVILRLVVVGYRRGIPGRVVPCMLRKHRQW